MLFAMIFIVSFGLIVTALEEINANLNDIGDTLMDLTGDEDRRIF